MCIRDSNKAVSDIYYPGSVFKPVTTAIALDSGIASLQTTFNCAGSYTYICLLYTSRCV